MKIIAKFLLIATALLSCSLGRGVAAAGGNVVTDMVEQYKLRRLQTDFTNYLGGMIDKFAQSRCQSLCVGIVKTFISPSVCPSACSEEGGKDKSECMKACHDMISGVTDRIGSAGNICSQTVCPTIEGFINGEAYEVVPSAVDVTPSKKLAGGGYIQLEQGV